VIAELFRLLQSALSAKNDDAVLKKKQIELKMVKAKRKVEIDEAAEVQDKVFIAKGKKQKAANFDVEDSEDEIPAIQKKQLKKQKEVIPVESGMDNVIKDYFVSMTKSDDQREAELFIAKSTAEAQKAAAEAHKASAEAQKVSAEAQKSQAEAQLLLMKFLNERK